MWRLKRIRAQTQSKQHEAECDESEQVAQLDHYIPDIGEEPHGDELLKQDEWLVALEFVFCRLEDIFCSFRRGSFSQGLRAASRPIRFLEFVGNRLCRIVQ